MIRSHDQSLMIELVAQELKRVHWISGHEFLTGEGYRLHWLPKGSDRMKLLKIALREKRPFLTASNCPPDCSESEAAVKAFWEACTRQLHLKGKEEQCAAFLEIIEAWEPDTPSS